MAAGGRSRTDDRFCAELSPLPRRGVRRGTDHHGARRRPPVHHVHIRHDRSAERRGAHAQHRRVGRADDRGDDLLPGARTLSRVSADVPCRCADAPYRERLPRRGEHRDAHVRSGAGVGIDRVGADHLRPVRTGDAQLHAAGRRPLAVRLLDVAVVHVRRRAGAGTIDRGLRRSWASKCTRSMDSRRVVDRRV